MINSCALFPQLKHQDPLPTYVRSIETIQLHARTLKKVTGIYLKKNDRYGIMAEGTIWAYPNAPPERGQYTHRLRHGIQDTSGKTLWSSVGSHMINNTPVDGRLIVGINNRRTNNPQGRFNVTIIVWEDADYAQMESFMEHLRFENPDHKGIRIALNQIDTYRQMEARREETQAALMSTEKELERLSAQNDSSENPVSPNKNRRIEQLESRLVELTATLADMERMKAELDQQRSRADLLSAELEERVRREQEGRRQAQAGSSRPPVLLVASPSSGHAAIGSRVTLSGVAEDDRGILSLKAQINGRPMSLSDTRGLETTPMQYPKRIQFSRSVPLTMGDNRIRVLVTDTEGLTTERVLTIHRNPLRRNVWAVVIGINAYPHLPRLNYAVNDANSFYDFLVSDNQIPKEKVTLLTDSQANLKNLRSLLGTELKKNAGDGDMVIIYFAGHGATERDTFSPDGDGLEKYLLPYDADPDDLYATALPMREIAHIFQRIRSQRLVFIADSCYSGASGGRTIMRPEYRANLSDGFLDRLSSGRGKVIITASSANEVSIEKEELGHGVFTYFLLKGLRGGADVDGDGVVTVDEAYRYTSDRVIEATGQEQHPVKKGSVEGRLVLGIVNG